MLDGLVGLILLVAVIRGIVKGIGDTVLRLLGLAGGLFLGVMYSDKVAAYLSDTKLRTILHDNIFGILRPQTEAAAADAAGDAGAEVVQMVDPAAADPVKESLPKAIGGMISKLADESAEAAADRLTDIAISILGFIAILLAIWIIMALLRAIYRSFRKQSILIGFVDRLGGCVLGIIRGTLLVCLVIAALIPVVTIFAPDKVPEIIDAMHKTYVAGIIYDINPMMLLVNYVIG